MSANKNENNDEIEGELLDDAVETELDSNVDTNEEALDGTVVDDDSSENEEDALAAALKKAEENWDMMLRTKAEMENLRRRNQKDVENAHKYGAEKIFGELIPIKDGLEMGIAIEDATVESLHQGMELTIKTLSTLFEKMSVEEINPKGEKFDPELHQAMTMQPTDEVEPNTVLEVLQKGYRLNERLIRPAMVIVSKSA